MEACLVPLVIPETISLIVPVQHFVAQRFTVLAGVVTTKQQFTKLEGGANVCLSAATIADVVDAQGGERLNPCWGLFGRCL